MNGTDWQVERVVRVVDGDTVRLIRSRVVNATDDFEVIFRDRREDGVSVRLVNLDTPERGQEGYTQAGLDLARWLSESPLYYRRDLRVITYPGGGFDRLLGDIYVEGRIGETATKHMIIDKGWPPYVKGQ